MEVFGKKDQGEIDKLLAAKAAMEAAGLAVPDAIAEKLGEGYEEKSPNELSTVALPRGAVRFHQEGSRSGMLILLDKIPEGIRELVVFHQLKTSDSPEKPESTSTEPNGSSADGTSPETEDAPAASAPEKPEPTIELPEPPDHREGPTPSTARQRPIDTLGD